MKFLTLRSFQFLSVLLIGTLTTKAISAVDIVEGIAQCVFAILNDPNSNMASPELIERTTYQEIPLFRNDSPNYEKFREEFQAYVNFLKLQGEPPAFALLGATGTTEQVWRPDMTPEELRSQYELSSRTFEPIRRMRGEKTPILSLLDFDLTTRNKRILETIRIFKRTGVAIRALDLQTALEIQIPSLRRSVANAKSFDVDIDNEQIGLIFTEAVSRYGCYVPRFTTPSVLLSSYYVIPRASENLLHEMTHVVQDVSWDLKGLLEIFEMSGLKKTIPDHFPTEWNENAKELHEWKLRTGAFLEDTLDPQYRFEVFQMAHERKFSVVEWLVFLELFIYLKEYDAHLQTRDFAAETRPIGEEYRGKNIHRYIWEIYSKSQLSIKSKLYLANLDFVERLYEIMDGTKKFRQSWSEWWQERITRGSRVLNRPLLALPLK